MNRIESAVALFEEGFSCSQAVLSACGPKFGLDRETALRVAGAFGGGMGGMGETCGAVTGAFMAIGLKHGRTSAKDEQAKERTNSLVKEFVGEFKERNASIVCRELLDHNATTGRSKHPGTKPCFKFVRDAAEILDRLLE